MICKATYGVLVGVLAAANFEVSNDKLEVGGIDDIKGVEVAVAVLILLGGLDSSEILVISVLSSSDIKVKLTRTDDRYLYLRERINFAEKLKADLFISIHADASKNRKASGFSIFSLSDKASDKEANELAQRENKSDFIG